MSKIHLNSEDAFPEPTEGLLRLYSMRYCPFSHRARLVLAAKTIPREIISVNVNDKPTWLVKRTKLGKTPTLEMDGKIIFDSIIISDYLDESFPNNKLHPDDPLQKATDKSVLEIAMSKGLIGVIGMVKPDKDREEEFSKLKEALAALETELQERSTAYFGGGKPSMLDYMLWPFFERMQFLEPLLGEQYRLPAEKSPLLLKWMESMYNEPAVKEMAISKEAYVEFFGTVMTGQPKYD